MDINSLRFIYCKECSSLHIPPNLNKTSTITRHAPTQYSSDITKVFNNFTISNKISLKLGISVLSKVK